MSERTGKWKYVKRASKVEKEEMLSQIESENEFQLQEPGGWDENDEDCPIHYRLEWHDGWQMQAYTPNGTMMDNSWHQPFIKCSRCRSITTYSGDDDTDQYCPTCGTSLVEYDFG